MFDIIVPAIAGLISGAIASLAAPWAVWGVEKRRGLRDARKKLIDDARQTLASGISREEFRIHPLYSQLRQYFSVDLNRRIEGTSTGKGLDAVDVIEVVVGSGRHTGVNPYAQKALDELAQLERDWGLI